jgi:hypothetical protein
MNVKRAFAAVGAASILALSSATMANATPDFDCKHFGRQVDTSQEDPHLLDADNDGIGCELEEGPPVRLESGEQLKPVETPKDKPKEELAKTGIGPTEHPIRWIAGSGTLVLLGGAAVYSTRRRTS